MQYDIINNNTFTVWKKDGTAREFKPAPNGLYYYDMRETTETELAIIELDPEQIKRMKANMEKYTEQQLKDTCASRYFQNTAGQSVQAMLKAIDDCVAMINMPITCSSVKTAEDV